MKLLRMKQVREVVPVAQSTIWLWVKLGKFPAPKKLSGRCTVWDEEEVQNFLQNA